MQGLPVIFTQLQGLRRFFSQAPEGLAIMQDFLLKLWQRTGLTVLLITHDVEEALVLAQRVHVLAPNPGRIIRSLDVDLDKTDLDQLRLSSDFLSMRRSLSTTMRELEPALS